MGDTPSTVNTPAQTVNQIIHAAIFDVAVKAAEAQLIALTDGVLAFPGLKQIDEALLNFIGNVIYTNLSLLATFQIIDIQVGSERVAYANAEAKLRAAHLKGDQNAIDAAIIEIKKALAALIHYDGSATP